MSRCTRVAGTVPSRDVGPVANPFRVVGKRSAACRSLCVGCADALFDVCPIRAVAESSGPFVGRIALECAVALFGVVSRCARVCRAVPDGFVGLAVYPVCIRRKRSAGDSAAVIRRTVVPVEVEVLSAPESAFAAAVFSICRSRFSRPCVICPVRRVGRDHPICVRRKVFAVLSFSCIGDAGALVHVLAAQATAAPVVIVPGEGRSALESAFAGIRISRFSR